MVFRSNARALALGVATMSSLAHGKPLTTSVVARDGGEGPCDIYKAGGTPCVAAHGLTRALYGGYSGPLYQLLRGDGATQDVSTSSAGGVANVDDQDSFCNGQTCCISIIYDQSGNENHLTRAPGGSAGDGPEAGGFDFLAGAYGAPVTLNGKRAYGMFGSPMTGYRNNEAKGIALNDDPEGMYAVFDGTHYDAACCFDYGNAEPDNIDPPGEGVGDGRMEALYFGKGDGWSGTGDGDGPWIMADLENYLFAGGEKGKQTYNPVQTTRFVTGHLKGDSGNHWALKSGDGNSDAIKTIYDGPRSSQGNYNPMRKEGAIVLGVGGDNSHGSQGTFYEGAMVSGYPSDDTDAKVQANIAAAGYAETDLNIGDTLTVGSTVTFTSTSACCTSRLLAHDGETVNTQEVAASAGNAQWTVRTGLGNAGCFSFESVDTPGSFIRHKNYQLYIDPSDGSQAFGEDATYCTQPGVNGKGTTIRSWSYSARYIRHFNSLGYIAANGGFNDFDTPATFLDDVSWLVGTA
ncbi:hypothetical protein N3K66_005359 [Trichothecium roseum]|uniref:Uncharacterized protein n=1 Tax=Trichothecium roseum TaxID=47278 RepID=A0ACC0UXN0_9HYPO|nr:hypothetical protein N3K66_005359 [Trichothecium roseum]